ncbi:hypothetical protein TWF281_001601 [Arthrobotrys megalospora]
MLRFSLLQSDINALGAKVSRGKTGILEIRANQIEIRNSAWEQWMNDLLPKVALAMGMEKGIRIKPELRGMRIYGYRGYSGGDVSFGAKAKDEIGILEIVLPGNCTGGKTSLTFQNQEQEVEAGKGEQFATVAVAWYSDVKYRSDAITGGYKVTLVYGLTTKKRTKPTAGNAFVCPKITQAVEEVRKFKEPVAIVLKNYYGYPSDTNGDFLGSLIGPDKNVLHNLIRAVEVVGGLALYYTDVYLNDEYRDCPWSRVLKNRGKFEYVNVMPQKLDFQLDSTCHLAGLEKKIDEEPSTWNGLILTLGKKLSAIKPDVDEDEWDYDDCVKQWRSSCVVLHPTSFEELLEEEIERLGLGWVGIRKAINDFESKYPHNTSEYGLAIGRIITKACLSRSFSDADVMDAGVLLEKILQNVPKDTLAGISDDFIALMNPRGLRSLGLDWGSSTTSSSSSSPSSSPEEEKEEKVKEEDFKTPYHNNEACSAIAAAFRMINLFPSGFSKHLMPAIHAMVNAEDWVADQNASVVRVLFNGLNWQPRAIIDKMLREIVISNPSENLRREIDEDMRKHLEAGSNELKIWTELLKKYHRYIIEGTKKRLPELLLEQPHHYPARYSYQPVIGYRTEPKEPEMQGGRPSEKGIDQITKQLKNYLNCLLGPDPAESRDLIALFLDAVQSLETSLPAAKILYGIIAQLAQILRDRKAILAAGMPAVSKFYRHYVDMISNLYPCSKPSMDFPDLSLPKWNSFKPCTMSGCTLCGPLNLFLQDPKQHTFTVTSTKKY